VDVSLAEAKPAKVVIAQVNEFMPAPMEMV
jgi:hypothetical protein